MQVDDGGQGVPGLLYHVGGMMGIVDHPQHDKAKDDPAEDVLHRTSKGLCSGISGQNDTASCLVDLIVFQGRRDHYTRVVIQQRVADLKVVPRISFGAECLLMRQEKRVITESNDDMAFLRGLPLLA